MTMGCAAAAAAGSFAAEERPVFSDFFTPPGGLDLYLRHMHDLTGWRRVKSPSRRGARSLEMTLRFSKRFRRATLFWDLSPVHFTRLRTALFNPNGPEHPVYFRSVLRTTKRKVWRAPYYGSSGGAESRPGRPHDSGAKPLPPGGSGWIPYEVDLERDAMMRTGREDDDRGSIDDAAFEFIMFFFEPPDGYRRWGEPLRLIMDGIECFA
ncbi:hypothetical protein [Kiritimatiella glycovorans]|uniref:Uncharacterized protein n=1 Tax=Kiritimatiella glycovorans TaxID=1307763 RepID=A0A0G3EH44_9BACT|nr:hypothetical protein [Kiritimatiella glycovorans]AKJ65678.1 hypothetical protein L21SP4_02453 [Kiritimatiella glycovorans]